MEPAKPFHPESKALIDYIAKLNVKPYHQLRTVEEARARSKLVSVSNAGPFQFSGTRKEYFIPQPNSSDTIPIYVYTPANLTSDPAIFIYYHGGGMVVGCRENVESTCQIIADGVGCLVVNVEYRLAPDHRFPAFLDDGCTAARWVLDNKTTLGGSTKSKVGIGGDSAGGTITAATAHDVPGLAFQVLIYPRVTALNDKSLKSYSEYKNGPIIEAELIDWFERNSVDEKDFDNPRIATILRPNFSHLPPTLFIVAECDPIRDDSIEYEKKLKAAGVHCELHLIKGAIHAFCTMPGVFPELCRHSHPKIIDFIKKWGAAS